MAKKLPTPPVLLSSDRPLDDPASDLFGHAPFAKAIAKSLLRDCPPEGLVIGIYGAWGLGKSTALNFLERYLVELAGDDDPPIVIRFNPWWFSGQDDLMRRFFNAFEAAVFKAHATRRKLKTKLVAFASALGELGAEAPVPGAKAASKALGLAAAAIENPDVVKLKADLVQELRKTTLRAVIIMDDIDRLTADEVRLMFRLIKAVADFPNVTYVLAFDRTVTGRALEEFHPSSGQDYLEKIIQVPFELPVPDSEQLSQMLFSRLDRALDNDKTAPLDRRRWARVYADAVQPFITKPRDVVRLANALSVTHEAVAGEVNVIDFIALEAWRVLEPALYNVVRDNPERFTGMLDTAGTSSADERRQDMEFHDSWLEQAGARSGIYKVATRCVFPRLEALWGNRFDSGEHWRNDLRLCSPDIFPVFFRLSVSPHSIAHAELQAIVALGGDSPAFGPRLLKLVDEKRPDGTSRARVFLDRLNDFLRASATAGLATAPTMLRTVLDVADVLVQQERRPRGFDFGIGIEIQAVVSNLIALVPPPARFDVLRLVCATGAALEQIVDCVSGLGSQYGRHGERAEPASECQLTEPEVIDLEHTIGPRLAESAQTGTVWQMRMPIRVLLHWRYFEGSQPLEAWVTGLGDTDLARLLGHFVLEQRTRKTRELRLESETFERFFGAMDLLPRVDALLTSTADSGLKPTLDLIAKHLRARKRAESGE
jgi:predicted KAP-like P-loop ATPase